MGLRIEGTIGRDELEEFLKLCRKRGWIILGNPSQASTKVEYLDRTMTKRVVLLGEETATWM